MSRKDRWGHDDVLEELRRAAYPTLEVRHGMMLTHTGSNTTGAVAGFSQGDRVVLVDRHGSRQSFRAFDGAFIHDGVRVALRYPTTGERKATRLTPSGSIAAPPSRARVARASRIWVEGIHDAELIEKIWGDDLRIAAVVVEPLHGVDNLDDAVARFRPGPTRRLGILLDHLVAGSKEQRIADSITDGDVLVCGHPYVDIWAAIAPRAIGIAEWPDVPHDLPWKEGVVRALGMDAAPSQFWINVLGAVESYRDVETPLVNAIEQLIDFVAAE